MKKRLPVLADLNLEDKVVLARVDFNVPLNDDGIADDTRIRAALPTIQALRDGGAKVVLMSHLGRPRGQRKEKLSLLPIAAHLASLIDDEVVFTHDTITEETKSLVDELPPRGIAVLENLRFNGQEKKSGEDFSKQLAGLADIYVNDAFGAMHRSHASITGIPALLPSVAGLLVEREVEILTKMLRPIRGTNRRPMAAILGGAKVSDKMGVISSLAEKVGHLFIGGVMAYTFMAAMDMPVGSSRVEHDRIDDAKKLLEACEALGVTVHLPDDHVVATDFSQNADASLVQDIPEGHMGLDIGTETIANWSQTLAKCGMVFWNGPMGVFEWDAFSNGTKGIAQTLAQSKAFTVVGGGDSAAAIAKFELGDQIDHISTGGGASLEYLERGDLVGLEALREAGR
jgi:phosphoglycerate kinase